MKPAREHLIFAIALLALALGAAVLWSLDLHRQSAGKSRIRWPAPVQPARGPAR